MGAGQEAILLLIEENSRRSILEKGLVRGGVGVGEPWCNNCCLILLPNPSRWWGADTVAHHPLANKCWLSIYSIWL